MPLAGDLIWAVHQEAAGPETHLSQGNGTSEEGFTGHGLRTKEHGES